MRDVRDADAELAASDPSADRREDLQIHDRSPLLLVEVKGTARPRPQESEALEVAKYLHPRARDLERTDIIGLTIINHQRHLPPAERAAEVFGADVITAAKGQHVGLLRAVDLYRLARGAVEYGWSADVTAERFWRPGLLHGRPDHLVPVGHVLHVFAKAQAVVLKLCAQLAIGDRIAVELSPQTVELDVTSLQQQHVAVERVSAGQDAGVFVGDLVEELREGMEVLSTRSSVPESSPPQPRTRRDTRGSAPA